MAEVSLGRGGGGVGKLFQNYVVVFFVGKTNKSPTDVI